MNVLPDSVLPMNIADKIRFLSTPVEIASGRRAEVDGWIIRYLGYRRSRLGFHRLLARLLRDRCYSFDVESAPPYRVDGRYADLGDYVAMREVFLGDCYDLSVLRQAPDLIVDVGAHIGAFALHAHRHFPEVGVVCIEPDQGNLKLFRRNCEQNGFYPELHEVAVSNRAGSGYLAGNSGIARRLSDFGDATVTLKKLSSLIDFGASNSLLLKIDVEGSEFDILDDCVGLLPRDTFMFVEVHEGESAVFRLEHILGEQGFEVRPTNNKGLAIDCRAWRGAYA